MDPITLFLIALAGSVIAGGSALGQSFINKKAQEDANKKNLELNDLNNQANLQAVRETNASNLALAREDRDFQLQMANTAHQREVADLKAAGLNPVLSAQGAGSSVVSSSTANQQAPSFNPGSVNPVAFDISSIGNAVQSITNLLLVSKLFGSTAPKKAYIAQNNAHK